jgi:hypothetical protein
MNKEYIRPFLSKTIEVCDRCGKVDIKTYARYKLKDSNYILDSMYSRCQNCEKIKEFTKEEIKQELK